METHRSAKLDLILMRVQIHMLSLSRIPMEIAILGMNLLLLTLNPGEGILQDYLLRTMVVTELHNQIRITNLVLEGRKNVNATILMSVAAGRLTFTAFAEQGFYGLVIFLLRPYAYRGT